MDAASRQFVNSFRLDGTDREADLSVDGLSESIFARLARLCGIGRS